MDPFGLSKKTISGSFDLKQWEDGTTYYLYGSGNNDAHGALEGTVNKLGWNKQYILVFQNDNCCGSGWRIINVKTKTISSLLDDNKIKLYPEVDGLIIYSAVEAWNKL